MSERTELQQKIIEEHENDPSQSDEEIAVEVDASSSYVNKVRSDYNQQDDDGDDESGNGKTIAFILILILIGILMSGESEAAMMVITPF